MATSNYRLFGGVQDRYVKLGSEELLRQFTPPANWRTLRVGALVSVADTAAQLDNVRLTLGLCAGTAGAFKAATPTHWCGLACNALGNTYWARYAGPPQYYSYVDARWARKQNGTLGSSGEQRIGGIAANDDIAANRRTPWIIDLKKNGTGLEAYFYAPSVANCQVDFSAQHFWQLMENPHGTFIYDSISRSVARYTLGTMTTFDEATYGTLDTFSIGWNKTTPLLEVYEYGVQRVE